jgi:hypothetical protein
MDRTEVDEINQGWLSAMAEYFCQSRKQYEFLHQSVDTGK